MDKSTLKILLAATAIVAGAGMAVAQGPGMGKDMGRGGPKMDFATLDVDGSGEITVEDLEAKRAERFAQFDTDGDGTVTQEEFIAHAQAQAGERAAEMFARLDADGDGTLSRDVLEGRMNGGPNPRLITRLDTDGSGGVSEEEFEAAQAKFAERRQGGHSGERGGKWGRSNH